MARLRVGGSVGRWLGKISGSLILAACLGAGLFGTWAVVTDWLASVESRGWPQVPCRIETSRVAEDPSADSPYRFDVAYSWSRDGEDHRGTTYSPHYDGSDDYAEAQRLTFRYPAGSTATCLVDPADAARAILRPASLWRGLLLLPVSLFVAVGFFGLAFTWGLLPREQKAGDALAGAPDGSGGFRTAEPPAEVDPPLSRRARTTLSEGRGCLAAFFGLFLLAGLGFLVPFFVLPALEVLEASGWREVPCTIERSWVATHDGDDGDTYSVEVLYAYEHDGRQLKGSRYGFMGGSSAGYEGKARRVRDLPAGTRTTCWVDPDDPTTSVLERGFTAEFLFGLIPLVFVAIGAGGMFFSWTAGRKTARKAADGTSRDWLPEPRVQDTAPGTGGDTVLEARHGPLAKFFGILLVATFWNGIVGVFVYQLVVSWRAGSFDGCLAVFLVPFVLVGLLLLSGVPYQFLALFNPRPVLTLGASSVPVGGSLLVQWRFRGAAGRLRRLRLWLEGQEEATYQQGTTTRTDESPFAQIELADLDRSHPLGQGYVQLEIPSHTMHSFESSSNKVVWRLKLHGEIRAWPDVSEEFELLVTPEGTTR